MTKSQNPFTSPPLIIWGALLLSNSVIAFIAVTDLLQTSSIPKSEGSASQIPFIMAAFFATLSFLIFKWSTKPSKNLGKKNFLYAIISWAFAEVVNILGLIAPILGATNNYYHYFFFTTIILMFLNHPRHLRNVEKIENL